MCVPSTITAIFVPQPTCLAHLSGSSASAGNTTTLRTARANSSPTVHPSDAAGTHSATWSTRTTSSCVLPSSSVQAVPKSILTSTNVLAAAVPGMELLVARSPRDFSLPCPYNVPRWSVELHEHNLSALYPSLVDSLLNGFNVGIPRITRTFVPKNSSSLVSLHVVFSDIVSTELRLGRYKGPYTKAQVEALIGPFQTSPLSLVPKTTPGTFRLIQNLSFPFHPISRGPTDFVASINSTISADLFLCTWGTFLDAALLFLRLPVGSQASTRDVADAYHTIPLAGDQLPGTVVRLSEEDEFAINLCNCFGMASAGGTWGVLADAFCDIVRARGMGPVIKWVDDFLFARIPRSSLESYNTQLSLWQALSGKHGRQKLCSRIFFRGDLFPDGRMQEFSEDFKFPLLDLTGPTPAVHCDLGFAYGDEHLDALSSDLAVPWHADKTTSFASRVVYLGFEWDLVRKTVSLPSSKKAKYKAAIATWFSSRMHTLREVEALYGKLMHSAHVVPAGRAYLTRLESMLGIFGNSPTKPHHAAKSVKGDLEWWGRRLALPDLTRALPSTEAFPELHAYSDASSGIGIGLVIGLSWAAFEFVAPWKSDSRDIAWAEAVGFELLLIALDPILPFGMKVLVYGDNQVVVQGWRNFRSQNQAVNEVFKRVHAFIEARAWTVVACYVKSASNPADDPSCGIPLKGPQISTAPLAKDLARFLAPKPLFACSAPAVPRPAPKREIANLETTFEDAVEELHAYEEFWREY